MTHSYRRSLYVVAACALALVVVPAVASASCLASGVAGRAALPAGGYVSPTDIHAFINSGGVITAEMAAHHGLFVHPVITQGGLFGFERETYGSTLDFTITGRGPLAGWSRTLSVPAKCVTDTAAHKDGDPIQDFDTNMYSIVGAVSKDADFSSFKIVAGTGNGLESPGHTTAYLQKDGSFVVDSTFQIKYSISYVGAPGGKLAGQSGTAEGVITMTCQDSKDSTQK